ncbi:hypothetical protein LTR70_004454 [Exophiala xenobiotica]|uniref:Telomeric single stranded DNA binding POT1/Cdc13 domain-containing protein n=1 Tax=Lithohypha guttulata TaxID=1690604 RepID=A0ABR0KDJ1_9EURO|nr:hypothetical protein LTR24_003932 [Lithohypha guttulata]KAK5320876.1 hypothetical protein LTR70_004454 [Exophiala xenobiotica]
MQEHQPRIAELLRTCIHPPSLLLRVAHVELVDVKRDHHDQTATGSGDDAQCFDGVHRFTLKFVLTDGELMIQALLHRKISGLRDAADVTVGDLLDIRTFAVKKSPRLSGRGHTVYLAIEDCHFLLQPASTNRKLEEDEQESAMTEGRKRRLEPLEHTTTSSPAFLEEGETAGGFLRPSFIKRPRLGDFESTVSPNDDDHVALNPQSGGVTEEQDICGDKSKHSSEKSSGKDGLSSTFSARTISSDNENEDEDDDFFEEAEVDLTAIMRRRKALRKLDSNISLRARSPLSPIQPNGNFVAASPTVSPPTGTTNLHNQLKPLRHEGTFSLCQFPIQPPQQWGAPLAPPAISSQPTGPTEATQRILVPAPPYHTLGSLRQPPPNQPLPSKNYAITTLAFISWIGTSLIHRSGSPFPPKRHLKIVDPSLPSSRPVSRDNQPPQVLGNLTFTAQTAFQDAVTVAVYIDAANFKPVAGTLALFRGLVMQRLANGDIILNVYGRLKEQRFDDGPETNASSPVLADPNDTRSPNPHWFVTDEAKIRALGHGSKFDYYREWWNAKHQGDSSVQTKHRQVI